MRPVDEATQAGTAARRSRSRSASRPWSGCSSSTATTRRLSRPGSRVSTTGRRSRASPRCRKRRRGVRRRHCLPDCRGVLRLRRIRGDDRLAPRPPRLKAGPGVGGADANARKSTANYYVRLERLLELHSTTARRERPGAGRGDGDPRRAPEATGWALRPLPQGVTARLTVADHRTSAQPAIVTGQALVVCR